MFRTPERCALGVPSPEKNAYLFAQILSTTGATFKERTQMRTYLMARHQVLSGLGGLGQRARRGVRHFDPEMHHGDKAHKLVGCLQLQQGITTAVTHHVMALLHNKVKATGMAVVVARPA